MRFSPSPCIQDILLLIETWCFNLIKQLVLLIGSFDYIYIHVYALPLPISSLYICNKPTQQSNETGYHINVLACSVIHVSQRDITINRLSYFLLQPGTVLICPVLY